MKRGKNKKMSCRNGQTDVHVSWQHGQSPEVDYRLEQDGPVDKEASYSCYEPKQFHPDAYE